MAVDAQLDQKETDQGACCSDQLSEEEMALRIDEVIDTFSGVKGALIPVLQTAQNLFGYLAEPVLKKVSLRLNIPYSEVAGVVSFYSYFSTIPRGKNIVRVCLGTACYVRGGKEVLQSIQDYLGIDVGGTTDDRIFSLEIGRCFGACGLAPVVMINDHVYQRVKPSKVKDLLVPYRVSEPCGEEE
ncbi:MAG: NAD(P)H-dependent oxidoreductase subunit E [Spirochaetaceae bacterium]|nr:NAD(P)H-dependent oxidoreductase subunit E [Spirochaetaceae bacterium]MCF7947763.1 NAD(P)H-dependent oxidoreductase subunit E [Spirochaetia bacterium]MCF7950626.1 NAD(P)H-dependent oxidoreductase subunit E [Spirochaetaceae bacterium]